MYMNGVFFYHHGFSKQNIKFVTVKHFYTLNADVNDKKLVLRCMYHTFPWPSRKSPKFLPIQKGSHRTHAAGVARRQEHSLRWTANPSYLGLS